MIFKKHHYLVGFMAATLLIGATRDFMDNQHPFMLPVLAAEKEMVKITRPTGIVESPDVALSNTGEAVIVWEEKNEMDYDIIATRVDDKGYPLSLPFRVNQYKLNDQRLPRIAMDAAGNFIIVWQSYEEDGSASGVYGQRFAANGQRSGNEFRVNTTTTHNQMTPDVAMTQQGEFIVVWVSEEENKKEGNSKKSIYAKRFNHEGVPTEDEWRVNTDVQELQTNPSIAITPHGEAMIVWQSYRGNSWAIYGRGLSAQGQASSSVDVLISQNESGRRTHPRIAADSSNQFVVVWEGYSEKEEAKGIVFKKENIRGRTLSAQGVPSGNAFDISTLSFDHAENPDVVVTPEGVVVVWQKTNEKKIDEEEVKINWSLVVQRLKNVNGDEAEELFALEGAEEFYWMPAMGVNAQGDMLLVWNGFDPLSKKGAIQFKRFPGKATEEIQPEPQAKRSQWLTRLSALLSSNQ